MWAETDPVSETLCSLAFRIADDGQTPANSVILSPNNKLE
jgi:hypothetical protein